MKIGSKDRREPDMAGSCTTRISDSLSKSATARATLRMTVLSRPDWNATSSCKPDERSLGSESRRRPRRLGAPAPAPGAEAERICVEGAVRVHRWPSNLGHEPPKGPPPTSCRLPRRTGCPGCPCGEGSSEQVGPIQAPMRSPTDRLQTPTDGRMSDGVRTPHIQSCTVPDESMTYELPGQ